MLENTGIVIIGRNEGERLVRCLSSVIAYSNKIIYVDSASTDGSALSAKRMGAEVVALDMSIPFTAARARNAGYSRMRHMFPQVEYVQFVDGDCELTDQWLEECVSFLVQHPDIAVVCGKLHERYPDRSVYNMLCNIEWDAPAGETKACGGNAMMRSAAFEQVKGFNNSLIAGEEPELCMRLRESGWKIWRLNHDMALHDAAILHFSQWWRRTIRTGYGYAEGAYLHGGVSERRWMREVLRALLWGIALPLLTLLLLLITGSWGMLILLAYPLQVIKLALRGKRSQRENWWHALFLVIGKFPEAIGQVRFLIHRLSKTSSRLIEYK